MKAKPSEDIDVLLENKSQYGFNITKNTVEVTSISGEKIYLLNSLARELQSIVTPEQFIKLVKNHLHSLVS